MGVIILAGGYSYRIGFRQEVPTANLFALIFNRDADLQYSSVVFMLFCGCY